MKVNRIRKMLSASCVSLLLLTNVLTPKQYIKAETIETDEKLLITEIVPNHNNYEYFEVYNSSTNSIKLDNRLFYDPNTKNENDEISLNYRSTTIEPKQTLVFWYNPSGKKTEEFIEAYQAEIEGNSIVEFSASNFTGLNNTNSQAILFANGSNNILTKAEYEVEDVSSSNSIQYKVPEEWPLMDYLEFDVAPTPGTVNDLQIEKSPNPNVDLAPIITHNPVVTADQSQDIHVSAMISDDSSSLSAKLYYQGHPSFEWKSVSMSKQTDMDYEGIIPKKDFLGEKLSYYIEVTDGKHTVTYPVDKNIPVTTEITENQSIDYNRQARLMVTEVVPSSTKINKADGYEFIEIYNNNNSPINLQNYRILYQAPNASDIVWDLTEDKMIQPKESFIVWIKNKEYQYVTLSEFNQVYGTSLTESKVTTINASGMSNSASRKIVIADDFGNIFSSASYNEDKKDKDVKENKGITYKYSIESKEMFKVGLSTRATPGTILDGQVPKNPVTNDNNSMPVISHSPVDQATAEQDLNISAQVADQDNIENMHLYFKNDHHGTYKMVAMTKKPGSLNTFEVTIPKKELWSDKITYYFATTDGVHFVKSSEYETKIKQPTYDSQKMPSMLITELVPDSTNIGTMDGYDFIEIYNNSDKDINFKDYKIHYRYPMSGPAADLIWTSSKEEVIIPSRKSLVFWFKNADNRSKTVDDFNVHYGSSLKEDVDIMTIDSSGMANLSDRGILITTNTGMEVASAYYNDEPNVKDTKANYGILYKYDLDGSKKLKKVSSTVEKASPGIVFQPQVPEATFKGASDYTKPTVEDISPKQSVKEDQDLKIVADAKDDNAVKTLTLYYRNSSQDHFTKVHLLEDFGDELYHYTIYSPELIGQDYIEYYFVASDGFNQNETGKQRVRISKEELISGLRLNTNDSDILSGKFVVKATDDSGEPKLAIDGKPVEGNIFRSLEKKAYFAFDVTNTNVFFKNGVTMDGKALRIFDDTINNYVTLTVPIAPENIKENENTVISIRSGTKVSPFDKDSEENRDNFFIKNVRLVLSDGTVIYDTNYNNPQKQISMGDDKGSKPFINFNFKVPSDKLNAYSFAWDTSKVKEGEHIIQATGSGSEIISTIQVDNTSPTIETNIESGKQYKGSFTIDTTIHDQTSGVDKSETLLDGKVIQVPYKTSSAKLTAGKHELKISAIDKAGNKGEKKVSFLVVDEMPLKPQAVTPKNGETITKLDPTLSVKVTDPTKDLMNVSFYKGYKYDSTKKENLKIYQNTAETEPPNKLKLDGEKAFSQAQYDSLKKIDKKYVTTNSTNEFPYQRFEVKLDKAVKATDQIEIKWQGKSLKDRKVTMYAWNYKQNKWVALDWKIAGTKDFNLTGSVSGSDYVRNQAVQVIVQDEIPPTGKYDYSFVWMSDTQYYSESHPHIYKNMVDWVVDNKEKMNIKYVFHTGDLVDQADDVKQWNYADQYMNILDEAKMPYGVLAGNHDVGHKTGDYNEFSKYFGEKRFKDNSYYGGSYKDNRGHYDLISAGGNDYIMIYMGWGVEQVDIEWMNEVLAKYPDRLAILSFHEYMLVSGNRSPIGDEIYRQVVVPNKNVIATLSGHYHDSELLVNEIDDNKDGKADRKVYQMLADYQGGPEGGQGFLRLLQVNPSENRIYVKTYSPYLNKYNFYDPSIYPGKDEFVIDLDDLHPREKQVATDYFEVNVYTNELIGKATKVKSGKTASTKWKGVKKSSDYAWYVKVSDQYQGTTISDIWTFKTK